MFSEMIIDRVKENPLVKKYIKKGEFTEKIYFLNAEGGYGKSTSFKSLYYYLVEQGAQANNHIVPIFIDVKQLVEFGEKGSAGNMPRPLEKYIVRNYCGKDTDPNETLLEKVINIFSKNNSPRFHNDYTYYIFVDGINEVDDSTKRTILSEIKEMLESDLVKFFISSRTDEKELPDETVKYKLMPLAEENIRKYLDNNFGRKYGEKVNISKINDSLVEILRVPMYLSVFRKTYDKKSPYPDIYEQTTVRKADLFDSYVQKILKDNKEKKRKEYNPLIEFVIKYYLPALAFLMIKENGFSIDFDSLEKLDINYFKTFFKGSKRESLKDIVDSKHYKPLLISCDTFSLIKENDNGVSFVHQNWRDLFVAKHIINCMNAEKLDDLEIPISKNVRQFVGELLREYKYGCGYSKDYMDESNEEKARKSECDFEEKDNLKEWSESPIEHFMQQHNMNREKPISTIGTRNLIEVMKTCRNNNITANYCKLDLTHSNFCATNCCNSNFRETKISFSTFSNYLDNISMDFVSISADNKLIIIVDEVVDKAIVLDINTGVVIKNFDYFDWRDDYCLYDRKPIFLNKDDCAHDYEIVETIQYENCIYKIYFQEISNFVDYYDNFDVEIIDDSTFVLTNHENASLKTEYHDNKVTVISFSGDGNRLISGNEQGIINIWEIENSKTIYEPLYSLVTDSEVKSISISDDNLYMITVHKNGEIIVWDYGSLKIKNIYAQRSFPILNSYFIDKTNNCIVLCYCEYGNKLTMLIYDLKYKRIVKGFNKSINGYYVVSSVCNKCAYIDNKELIHIFDYILDSEITIEANKSKLPNKSFIMNFSPDGTYISLKNIYMQDDNVKIVKYLIFDLNSKKCIFIINEGTRVNVDSFFYFVDGEWKTFTDKVKTTSFVDDEYASFLFQYKDDNYLAYENAENQSFEQIGYIIPTIITGADFHDVKLELNNKKDFLKILFLNGGEVGKSFNINNNNDNSNVQSRKNIRFNTELVNVFTDNINDKHLKKYALNEHLIDNKICNKHCHFILNKLERIFGCDNIFYYDDALFIICNFRFQIYYLPFNLKVLSNSIEYSSSSNELVFVATGGKKYIVTFSLNSKQFRLMHIHEKYLSLFIYDYILHTNYIEIRDFCVDNGIEYLYGSNLKELSFYVFEIINNKCTELIIQKLEFDYFVNIYIENSHVYFIEKKQDEFNIEAIISNKKIEQKYTFKITDVYLKNEEKTTYYLTLKGEEYKHLFCCESKIWGFSSKEIRFDSRKKELYLYNNQTD